MGQIGIQLNQLKRDLEILQMQFQLLLNSNTFFVPDTRQFKKEWNEISDSMVLKEHPVLKRIAQEQELANASHQLERSRLLPELNIGYNNAGIQGTGADNKLYPASKRFHSVQLGIGIPIFAKAQKAKIKSALFQMQIAESNYAIGLKSLQSDFGTALVSCQKYQQTVQYFENTALKNAALITSTANTQLANGNINYLEWVQLINQATTVKSDYLEAVKNLNESILELNYFINK